MGVAKKNLEKVEEKIKQEFEEEIRRKKQKFDQAWQKMREHEDLHAKVNERVAWEHTELTTEVEKLHKLKAMTLEPTYVKVISWSIQTVPVPVSMQVPVLQREVSVSTNGKEKGKEKRKDKEGESDMENRFREYEDLSDQEVAPRTVNQSTPATRVVRAIVVYGIACKTPIISTSQMVK